MAMEWDYSTSHHSFACFPDKQMLMFQAGHYSLNISPLFFKIFNKIVVFKQWLLNLQLLRGGEAFLFTRVKETAADRWQL